jgi:hypothetical protein
MKSSTESRRHARQVYFRNGRQGEVPAATDQRSRRWSDRPESNTETTGELRHQSYRLSRALVRQQRKAQIPRQSKMWNRRQAFGSSGRSKRTLTSLATKICSYAVAVQSRTSADSSKNRAVTASEPCLKLLEPVDARTFTASNVETALVD